MVNQRFVVCRPVGDGVKRRAHDADLKRMVVIRSPSPQLVPQAASIWETTPREADVESINEQCGMVVTAIGGCCP